MPPVTSRDGFNQPFLYPSGSEWIDPDRTAGPTAAEGEPPPLDSFQRDPRWVMFAQVPSEPDSKKRPTTVFDFSPKSEPEKPESPITGIHFGDKNGRSVIEFFPPEPAPAKTIWKAPRATIVIGALKKKVPNDPVGVTEKLKEANRLLFKEGRPQEARRIINEVLKIQPRNEEAHYLEVMSYLRENNLKEAGESLDRFVRQTPKSPLSFMATGILKIYQEKFSEAAAALEMALKSFPDSGDIRRSLVLVYANLENPQKVKEMIAGLTAETPEEKAEIAIMRVVYEDKVKGISDLEKIAQESPNNADILGNTAFALMAKGEVEKAEKMTARALQLNPNQHQALLAEIMGIWQKPKGMASDPAGFISRIQRVQKMSGADKEVGKALNSRVAMGGLESSLRFQFYLSHETLSSLLVRAYFSAGRIQELEQVLTDLKKNGKWASWILPDYEAVGLLGETKRIPGKKDEAEALYREALGLKPDHAINLARYIYFLDSTGQSSRAEPYVEQLRKVKLPSGEGFPLLALGIHRLLHEKKPQEAEPLLRRAVEIEPEQADYHRALAGLYHEMKKTNLAVREARRAIELGDIEPVTYILAVESVIEEKRWDELAQWTREFLKRFPQNVNAAHILGEAMSKFAAGLLGQEGLGPMVNRESGVHILLSLAQECLESAIAHTKKPDNELKNDLMDVLFAVGHATLSGFQRLEDQRRPFFLPVLLKIEGQKGADKSLEEVWDRLSNPNFSSIYIYALVAKGHIDFARALFFKAWNHPQIDREQTIPALKGIVDNPFPPAATPLVATISFQMAEFQFKKNELKEAKKYYQKAVELDPNNQMAWTQLIRTCHVMGSKAEAAKYGGEYKKRFSVPAAPVKP